MAEADYDALRDDQGGYGPICAFIIIEYLILVRSTWQVQSQSLLESL